MSEVKQLQAAIDGNAAAFEKIVIRYQSLVCAITFSGTGRVDVSEELAQETFLNAWKNLRQLRDLGGFRAWLCAIARNRVHNYYREKKLTALEPAHLAGVADQSPSPSENAISQEEQAMLEQTLMQLPEDYRQPLVMYYRQGQSTKEVAASLGMNESTVRTRLHRARQMVREEIAARLEKTLKKTGPDKSFTKAVMIAVGATGIGLTAATVEATTATTSGTAGTVATVLSTAGAKIATAAAVAVITIGAVFAYKHLSPSETEMAPAPSGLIAEAPADQKEDVITPENQQSDLLNTPKTTANLTGNLDIIEEPAVNLSITEFPKIEPVLLSVTPEQAQGNSEHEFKPKGVLSGLITDVITLEPIPEIEVTISSDAHGERHKAKTDPNGLYFFENIRNDGSYQITLKAEDYIAPDRWTSDTYEYVLLAKDKQFVKHYELDKGCQIEVKAVDEQGLPVKDVRVWASYLWDVLGKNPKKEKQSDHDGFVAIGGLKPSEYFVTAMHRDYALAGQKIAFGNLREVKTLTFELQKGFSIKGLALCSDGLPASGWDIDATPSWWHSTICAYDHVIDKEGYFILEHVIPGDYKIGIDIPKDGGSQGLWSTKMTLPPDSNFLELNIPKPSPHGRVSISGNLKFIGGTPKRSTWVHATSDAGHYSSVSLQKGQTKFVLKDLVPGLYQIDFDVMSGEAEDVVFKDIIAPSEELILEIPIKQSNLNSIIVKGKVIDKETLKPIPQFKISVSGTNSWREISDPNGLFAVQTSIGKECRIRAKAEGYVEKSSDLIKIDSNEPVVIELGIGGAIEGHVVDENNNPIKDAIISYRYNHGLSNEPDAKFITKTDPSGLFTIEDIPERSSSYSWYEITHPDYASVIKQIEVEEGYVTEETVTLKKGGTIEGFVYDEQGNPVANSILYFLHETQYSDWKENRGRLGSVTTDPNGFYRINHMPEMLCHGFRHNPDDQLGTVHASVYPQNGKTVRLDFGGHVNASGQLFLNGKPAANIKLTFTGNRVDYEKAFQAYSVTDERGMFTFRGIPSGRRLLYWEIPGIRSWGRWAKLGEYDFENNTDFDLGYYGLYLSDAVVQITSESPDNSPSQLQLNIQQYDEKKFETHQRLGVLQHRNEAGEPYIFTSLTPGSYEVIGKRIGHPTIRKGFEIIPDQTTYVDLQIPSGSSSISGKVISKKLNSSASWLKLRSVNQELTAETRPSADGSYEFRNLPAGDYIIGKSSVVNSRESVLKEFHLASDEHKEIEITIDELSHSVNKKSGYLVALFITEEGFPLPGVNSWLEQSGETIKPHFDIERSKSYAAKPGKWTLCAEYPGYRAVRQTALVKDREECSTQELLKPIIITMTQR